MLRRSLMSIALLSASAGLFVAMPANAIGADQHSNMIDPALVPVLSHPRREADLARDVWRHPAQALAFCQVAADSTVVEYAPGGGWYSRILAPYLAERGKYIGMGFNPVTFALSPQMKIGAEAFVANFPAQAAAWGGGSGDRVMAAHSGAIADGMRGSADRVMVMRMMHNLHRWNVADAELKAMRDLLKPDGLLCIEQHRARPDAPYSYADGSKGYLRQDDVIKFVETHGFELVATSELNANPADTANWPEGVWALPPADRGALKGEHLAIGESDRMTLLFRKRP